MSGFDNYGIDHTSASSINMWATAPCAWVAKYLHGRKFNFSHAARAGVLAEEAVTSVLALGLSAEDAIKKAQGEYAKATALGCSDADTKRGEAIKGMIEMALAELEQYGTPEFNENPITATEGKLNIGQRQKKVSINCKGTGWELPVIGYLDYYYPKHGLIVDLKTTMRLPSEMSDEHLRQGAIYRQASGNMNVKFLYVTGKGCKWHETPEPLPILHEIKAILNRQEAFLRAGPLDFLTSIVPVNQSSWFWSDDSSLRKELYGI
jgi:hypothetical protein